jgi:hypothetical protein
LAEIIWRRRGAIRAAFSFRRRQRKLLESFHLKRQELPINPATISQTRQTLPNRFDNPANFTRSNLQQMRKGYR